MCSQQWILGKVFKLFNSSWWRITRSTSILVASSDPYIKTWFKALGQFICLGKKLLRDKEKCITEGTRWSLQLQALTFCSIWALEYNVSPHSSPWQTSWSTWWRGHHSLCMDVKRPSFVSIYLCTRDMYLTSQMPSHPCFYYGSFKLHVLTVKKISMSSSEPSRLNMFHIEM